MGWLSDDLLTQKMDSESNSKNWYAKPENQVDILMPDGSMGVGYLCPGFVSTTYKSNFRKDIGFYKVRYKVCSRACMSKDDDEFSVCALLSDRIWRKCKSDELVEYAISIGDYEK
jgi:hypothetical protein